MTHDLRSVQRLFWRAIAWPTGVADFLAHADAATRAAFEQLLCHSAAFSRNDRVDVYAESYYWRLETVLRDQFRVAAWLCDDAAFHDLCTDFVWQRPSRHADVRRYGEPFVEFVAEHALARSIVGLADVVAIQWAAVVAIDAPDVPKLTAAQLAAVPLANFPALRFSFAPGVALLPCRLDYAAMWRARERGDPSPTRPLAPLDPPQSVLVWRKGLEVFHRSVAADEAQALSIVRRAGTFAEICAAAEHDDAEVAAQASAAWLRRWIDDELFAKTPATAGAEDRVASR